MRLPKTLVLRGLLVAAVTAAVGCDEKLSSVTGPTPNLEVSFASIRSEILTTTDTSGRTACIACHTSSGSLPPPLGLSFSTDPYTALVNRPSRGRPGAILVVPGDPANSYLIAKLRGVGISGVRMPMNGPPYLTEGQIQVIERWIALGAQDN